MFLALSSVSVPRTHSGCISDPITQTTFGGGLDHMRPHSFSTQMRLGHIEGPPTLVTSSATV